MDIHESRIALGGSKDDLLSHKKLCLVLLMNGDCCISIVDLAADPGDGFVEACPNLRIPYGFGVAQLCVVGSTLYIFSIGESPRCCTPEVYRFNLSSTVMKSSDCIIDKEILERAESALGPKAHAQAIPYHVDGYGTVVVLFSTEIMFWDKGVLGANMIDFEIYDPKGHMTRKLPQLLVCPENCFELFPILQLFHPSDAPDGNGFILFQEFTASRGIFRRDYEFFRIYAFGFNGDQFLIQTDLGRMFALSLGQPNDEWRVCEEGIKFQSYNMNFVAPNGLYINAYGVGGFQLSPDYGKPCGVYTQMYEVTDYCSFPRSLIGSGLRPGGGPSHFSIALIDSYPSFKSDSCMPCIAHVAFESTKMGEKKPYWFLDVFQVNLHKIAAKVRNAMNDADLFDEMDGEKYQEYVQRVKSFKFCLHHRRVLSCYVLGLFPF